MFVVLNPGPTRMCSRIIPPAPGNRVLSQSLRIEKAILEKKKTLLSSGPFLPSFFFWINFVFPASVPPMPSLMYVVEVTMKLGQSLVVL